MRRGYPTRPVTPTVSMSSRGRWLAPDAVGPVGFRALQCLLPWLAMVAFGCGVAPTRPAPICEQCIRKDPCDHDYIRAVASDTTTDHPSIVLEVSWSDEPHADLRSSSAASRSWVARGTRASRPCATAPSPSSASKARDQSGCVHHHRHYAVPNARPRPAGGRPRYDAARSAKYPSIGAAPRPRTARSWDRAYGSFWRCAVPRSTAG